MKQSNYIARPRGLTAKEKELIESYFFGNKAKAVKNYKGSILNNTKIISKLTGITEARINRYIDKILREKRKNINENQ